MMIKKYLFIFLISFILIGGCSNKEDKTTAERSGKEHILSDQVRAIEKAKQAQQTLEKNSTDKRIREIEEQKKED